MGMVYVHLRIRVGPDGGGALRAFLREATPFYEAPGGIRVRLLADASDPDRFIEVVEYEDEGAYERDRRRVEGDPVMKGYLERWRGLLAEAPVVEVYREEAGLRG